MRHRTAWLAVALVAALLPALAPSPALTQDADMAWLEHGMRIYRSDGVDCELCHGWNGLGRGTDTEFGDVTQTGGPALFTSLMTREQMIEMVSCGRIFGDRLMVMPQYRGDAWTRDLPCWGMTFADISIRERPVHGKRQLGARDIEAVVDYVRAAYQGKRISLEWCEKYFPQSKTFCDRLVDARELQPPRPQT